MKRFLLIVTLLAITLILSACSNELETGMIVDKAYSPAYTWTGHLWTSGMMIPQGVTIPAQYRILVQGTNEKGSVITEWWHVDAVTYGRLQAGMMVARRG